MAKFKALLWREWRLSRRQTLGACFACLELMILYWLVGLSMQFGNLRNLADDEREITKVVIGFLGCFVMILAPVGVTGSDGNLHKSDLEANWLSYSYSLPISAKERAFSRTLFFTAAQLISIVIAVISLTVFSKLLLNAAVTWRTVMIPVLFSVLTSFGMLVTQFFVTKARDRKSNAVMNAKASFLCMGIYVAFILLFSIHGIGLTKTLQNFPELEASTSGFLYIISFGQPERMLALLDKMLIAAIPVWILLHVLIYLTLYHNLKRSVIS